MPAGRFILANTRLAPGEEIELPPDLAHQVRDVLRKSPDDAIELLDGRGGEYEAVLTGVDRKRVTARLTHQREGQAEPQVRIVLCQGMLKAAKFETVLQKGTELGVAEFVPLLTERAVAAAEATGESKRARWARIAAEAVEQCGGSRLPEIAAPAPLMYALASARPGSVTLMPWEGESRLSLRSAVRHRAAEPGGVDEIRILIGPEGGFSEGEVALAHRNGAIPVTLGPRVLRAETAAIVAVSLALDAIGALETGPAGVSAGDEHDAR